MLQRQVNLLSVTKKGYSTHPRKAACSGFQDRQTSFFQQAGLCYHLLPSSSGHLSLPATLFLFFSLGIKIRNFLVPWNPIYCSASSVTIQDSSWIFKEICFQSLLLLICLHRCLNILLGFRGIAVLKSLGTVSLKALPPLLLQKHFVSVLFDGKSYLFGFEGVLWEWEERSPGSDVPIKEGIVTLNRGGFIIFGVIHPSGRKYLPLPERNCFAMFTIETKVKK